MGLGSWWDSKDDGNKETPAEKAAREELKRKRSYGGVTEKYNRGESVSALDRGGKPTEADWGELYGKSQVRDLYGRDITGTSLDVQDIRKRYLSRLNQDEGDIATNQLKGQRNSQISSLMSKAQKAGVSGGSRLGMADQAGRSADRQIAGIQDERAGQRLSEYKGVIGKEASNQLSFPLAKAGQAAGSQQISPAAQQGLFDSVVCTQLYKTGLMNTELYLNEQAYGQYLIDNKPHVYVGYRLYADNILVPLMKFSPVFNKFMSYLVLPWANNAYKKPNLFGKFLHIVGYSTCYFTGKLLTKFGGSNVYSN